jgi:hypothetical protein
MIACDFPRRIPGRADNSTCMLLLAVATLACAPQGSLGKDLPGSDDTGTADTTAEGSGSPAATNDTADGTSSASTAGSGEGTASTGTASTGTASDGSTTAADACTPLPEDDACTTCTKGHCCAEHLACLASEPCTCIGACIADGGDPTGCAETHCGGPNDEWIHLHDCRAEPCLGVC